MVGLFSDADGPWFDFLGFLEVVLEVSHFFDLFVGDGFYV